MVSLENALDDVREKRLKWTFPNWKPAPTDMGRIFSDEDVGLSLVPFSFYSTVDDLDKKMASYLKDLGSFYNEFNKLIESGLTVVCPEKIPEFGYCVMKARELHSLKKSLSRSDQERISRSNTQQLAAMLEILDNDPLFWKQSH